MFGRSARNNLLMFTLLLGAAAGVVLMGHTPQVDAQKADAPKAGGQTFMVANQQGQEIAFFDSMHKRLAVIDTPPRPHEIHLSPDKRTAYCPIFGDGDFFHNIHPGHEIYVIDVASRKLKNVIDVSPYQAPHSIAWDADGFMWVTCDKSNCVICVDVKTGKVVANVPTESQGSHWMLALPDGKKAYTSNKFSPFLSVIDLKNRKMIKKIVNPAGSEGIALSPDGKKLYFVNHREWVLQVVDTTKDEIVNRLRIEGVPPIPATADPLSRVAITPDGKRMLISFFLSSRLVFLDVEPLKQVKVIPTANGPMGFAFPADKSKAYMTNFLAGTISIIDLNKMEFIDTFASSKKPICAPETITFVD